MWLFLLLAIRAATPVAASSEAQSLREGPIDFRCDHGQAYNQPSRFECRDNVVLRRGDLLLCCANFEGYRDDKGAWQRFVCEGDVRARRGDELMWSDRATFLVTLGDLLLDGRPLLIRGQNVLEGERIVVDTKYDQARVEKPKGRFDASAPQPTAASQLDATAPLPDACPLVAAPGRAPAKAPAKGAGRDKTPTVNPSKAP